MTNDDDAIIADFHAIMQSRPPAPPPANDVARKSPFKALNRVLLAQAVQPQADDENDAPEGVDGSAGDGTT